MIPHQEGEMEWVTVRVVGPRQEGVEQGAEHTLDNLTNSASYEAIVQVGQTRRVWKLFRLYKALIIILHQSIHKVCLFY